MDKVTQSNAAAAEESASASEELAGQAKQMTGVVRDLMEIVGNQEDALKEIANIVCGRMLRTAGGKYDNGLPMKCPIKADEQWQEFIASDGVIVVDAEGTPIGLRLRLEK